MRDFSKAELNRLGGFVLAAGEGRRLRPVTLQVPKAALPFCGVPLVSLAARAVATCRLDRIVVNTYHLGRQIEEALSAWPAVLPPILFSRESELLNTGGGLRKGIALAPNCETFLVHNADVVCDFPCEDLLHMHMRQRPLATVLLVPGAGPQTVQLRPDGGIADFRRKPGMAPYTFAGIYIIERALLDYLPPTKAPSIVEAMEKAILAGRVIGGLPVPPETFWSDLGTLESYMTAGEAALGREWPRKPWLRKAVQKQKSMIADLRAAGTTVSGGIGLGDGVSVSAGSRLHHCVLADGVKIKPAATLAFAFILNDIAHPGNRQQSATPDDRILRTLDVTGDQITVETLFEQGSGRTYRRLRIPDGRTFVWMSYSLDRPENALFASCADFLRQCRIRAPQVIVHLADVCELLMTDLGDIQLRTMESHEDQERALTEAVRMAARLHVEGARLLAEKPIPLERPFDEKMYRWERDYFRDMTLEGVFARRKLWTAEVESECRMGQNLLLKAEQVPVHRDLQGANIMIHEGKVYFIDFQGMRMGVGAYDVASLLYDPYRCWPPPLRHQLWRSYCAEIEALQGVVPDALTLAAAAVQRLLQALGAFGKLWLKDGRNWYKQFVRPGLQMLTEATEGISSYLNVNQLARELAAHCDATTGVDTFRSPGQ